MISQELSNYVFISKYARYLPEKKRRETWKESVDRIRNMMLEKYKDCNIDEDINWAYDLMQKKRVLGSQRVLQFGGKAVLDKNCRAYNCTASYCDRLRFFQECMYVLLCGVGAGYSVQKHHIDKLPNLIQQKNKSNLNKQLYVIPDSIEGWSDSIGVLLSSYFENPVFPEYYDCEVEFDYSLIRPKGSYLSSASGKAPGPEPLKLAHKKIKEILDQCLYNGQFKLRPINAHDIICHLSDAVLAGGVRRSALLALFSKDDKEMFNAKIGDWFINNRQRARANNSVILLRNETTFEEFQELFKYTKEFGEPAIVWADNYESLYNPCFQKDTRLLTDKGYIKIIDLINNEKNKVGIDTRLINDNYGVTLKDASKVCLTQKQANIYEVITSNNQQLLVTQNHTFILSNLSRKQTKDLKIGDEILLQSNDGFWGENFNYNQGLILGLITGDGYISTHNRNKKIYNESHIEIWSDDFESIDKIKNIYDKETSTITFNRDREYSINCWVNHKKRNKKSIGGTRLFNFLKDILNINSPKEIKNKVPECVFQGSMEFVKGYLQGIIFCDGSINKKGISINQSNLSLLRDIQILLQNFGITSKIFLTRKGKKRLLPNGKGGYKEYLCKDNYDLKINISNSQLFYKKIGLFGRKNEIFKKKINILKENRIKEKYKTKIKSITYYGKEDVYCLTQPDTNSVIANGVVIGQCGEVNLFAYDEQGKSGWEFCNLCTINSGNIIDEQDLYDRSKAAAIIGTLQAGFTDFSYLGPITENIVRKESLLGVSLSGIMEQTDITLDKKILKKAVDIIRKTNDRIAQKININPAARLTCIKPDGQSSCLLGTSSGIHPHHSKRYIRRVQNNNNDSVYKFFKENNEYVTEKSVWSANKNDENILFPIEVKDGSKTKNQVSAIEMLDTIKLIQENWVGTGKNIDRCVQPWLNHNVSTTIVVRDNEWDDLIKRIYKDRQFFGGLSFLSDKGDKDYQQPPFSSVLTSREIVKEYGEASIWCSGLIELGLQAFENNLWDACDFILRCQDEDAINHLGLKNYTNGSIKQMESDLTIASLKIRFLTKFNKFAKNYFDSDIKRLTYCIKDVYNWKLYNDLLRNFKKIDYSLMVEKEDYTNFEGEVACSGGACSI